MKRLLLVPVLFAALSLPAAAQGAARAHVLNWGILILGAPPFLILAGFVGFVFSKNKHFRQD